MTEGGTYFRFQTEGEDPAELLDPERQWTAPWGDDDEGRPCDKCLQTGRTAIKGPEVPVERICPACEGTGRLRRLRRRGVSVFADREQLLRYMERRGTDLAGCTLVEVRGELSEDEDFDADEGAVLVHPTEIVAVHPVVVGDGG